MTLVVAAVDIGNDSDIPKRTLLELKGSDIVICEYINSLKQMMLNIGIDISSKELIEFNPYISMPEKTIQNIIKNIKMEKK